MRAMNDIYGYLIHMSHYMYLAFAPLYAGLPTA